LSEEDRILEEIRRMKVAELRKEVVRLRMKLGRIREYQERKR